MTFTYTLSQDGVSRAKMFAFSCFLFELYALNEFYREILYTR